MFLNVRVVDNNIDEIHITLNDKPIRYYYYANEDKRRLAIAKAREFAEGWYQARQIKES